MASRLAKAERLGGRARWLILGLTVCWLAFRLDDIGWRAVWAARPMAPAFYAICLLAYFVLPAADAMIYRRLWGVPFWASVDVFLRKRIYNAVVVGYSGEVGLLLWARRHVPRGDAALAHAIKDTNILSAAISAYGAAILAFWLIGHFAFDRLVADGIGWWGALTVAIAAAMPVALLARWRILAMDASDAWAVLSIHGARFVIGLTLTLAMWHAALTAAPWTTLISLLALQVLVNRIPLVPNSDLLFAGVALTLSDTLALTQAGLAGVLLTVSAMQQALHLVVFVASAAARRRAA